MNIVVHPTYIHGQCCPGCATITSSKPTGRATGCTGSRRSITEWAEASRLFPHKADETRTKRIGFRRAAFGQWAPGASDEKRGGAMRGLDDKTAIVVGGSTMIGQSVAETLVGYGADVVIADINEADGEPRRNTLGGKARFIRCRHHERRRHCRRWSKETVEATGRLDFLVNVACTYLDNGAETTRADWLTAFNVNLVGSVMLMQAARPHLEQEQGRDRQFRLDLFARGADRALGLSRSARPPSCN